MERIGKQKVQVFLLGEYAPRVHALFSAVRDAYRMESHDLFTRFLVSFY